MDQILVAGILDFGFWILDFWLRFLFIRVHPW